jgi:LacI family transcriptional regulator
LGECGEAAATRLLDFLHGSGEQAGTLSVETELVLRGSTGRVLPAN